MTQKELILNSRIELERKFREKYPNGEFVFTECSMNKEPYSMYLNWIPKRRTSHALPKGIGFEYHIKNSRYTNKNCEPDTISEQNSADFAVVASKKIKNSDSLEGLINKIRDYCPQSLIDSFSEKYSRDCKLFTKYHGWEIEAGVTSGLSDEKIYHNSGQI